MADLDLDDDALRDLYEAMVRARSLDERGFTAQRQGRIETWVPCEGQEAAQVGAGAAIDGDDWLAHYGRQHGAELVRGRSMADLLALWSGRESANAPPEGLNHLPPAIPIGTHLPHAVGVAWAAKLGGTDEVCLVHFGDGSASGPTDRPTVTGTGTTPGTGSPGRTRFDPRWWLRSRVPTSWSGSGGPQLNSSKGCSQSSQ